MRRQAPDTGPTGRAAPDPRQVLRRIEWTVLRRLDGIMQGDYRSFFHGTGLELSQLREYQPGDDVRAIDWNVTARTQIPHVRELIEDREITIWFLLDLSPSMDYGPPGRTKRDLLAEVVGILGRLLTLHGNRVGALLFSGSVPRALPAAGGRAAVVRLISEVQDAPRLARSPRTDLGSLIAASHVALTRRSFAFLVSDFMSVDGWDRQLSLLTRRHEVLAVRLSDPSETRIPDLGPIVLADAETGEQVFVDTHDWGFRARFGEAASRREAGIKAALRRAESRNWPSRRNRTSRTKSCSWPPAESGSA